MGRFFRRCKFHCHSRRTTWRIRGLYSAQLSLPCVAWTPVWPDLLSSLEKETSTPARLHEAAQNTEGSSFLFVSFLPVQQEEFSNIKNWRLGHQHGAIFSRNPLSVPKPLWGGGIDRRVLAPRALPHSPGIISKDKIIKSIQSINQYNGFAPSINRWPRLSLLDIHGYMQKLRKNANKRIEYERVMKFYGNYEIKIFVKIRKNTQIWTSFVNTYEMALTESVNFLVIPLSVGVTVMNEHWSGEDIDRPRRIENPVRCTFPADYHTMSKENERFFWQVSNLTSKIKYRKEMACLGLVEK